MIAFDSTKDYGYYVAAPKSNSSYLTMNSSHVSIFPNSSVTDSNDSTTRKRREITGFAKSIKKQLKMTFNDTLPDCKKPTSP